MHKQEMAEIMFELKKELAQDLPMEPHQRELMNALVSEIEDRINDPQVSMSGDQFLLTRLKEVAEVFETKHPALTAIVGRLSDVLARMGI